MTYTATAYFVLEPTQGPTACVQCEGTGKVSRDQFGIAASAGGHPDPSCGMCHGTGKVDAPWNPRKIYRYAGCSLMPEGSYGSPQFPGGVMYASESARCPDMASAMAWLNGWLGKTLERQS